MVYADMPNLFSISLFCGPLEAKNPTFCHFWTSAFCGVTSWRQSEQVEHGCTTTNIPLSDGIKTVSILKQLHGEIVCTNFVIQMHDGHTNKQTKITQRFWPPRRRVIQVPPNLAW